MSKRNNKNKNKNKNKNNDSSSLHSKKTYDSIRREKEELNKLSLDKEKEDKLFSLFQQSTNNSNNKINTNNIDFSNKKLIKQIEIILDKLMEYQFNIEQSQQAIRGILIENNGDDNAGIKNLTISNALDWLCLHLDAKDLPIRFKAQSNADSLTISSKTNLNLDVVNKGYTSNTSNNNDRNMDENENNNEEEEEEMRILPSSVVVEEKGGKEPEPAIDNKAWILSYMNAQEEEEENEFYENQEKLQREKKFDNLSLEDKISTLERDLNEERRIAKEKKSSGKRWSKYDKAESEQHIKELGSRLSMFRKELQKSKIKVSNMKADSVDQKLMDYNYTNNNNKKIIANDDDDDDDDGMLAGGGLFGFGMDEEEDYYVEDEEVITQPPPPPTTTTTTTTEPITKKEKEEDEDTGLGGMFGMDEEEEEMFPDTPIPLVTEKIEEEAEEKEKEESPDEKRQQTIINHAPADILLQRNNKKKKPKKKGAEGGGKKAFEAAAKKRKEEQEQSIIQEEVEYIPHIILPFGNEGIPKSWTGTTPKRYLQDWVKKKKYKNALKFLKKGQFGDSCHLHVKIGNKSEMIFESNGEFNDYIDLENAAACRALYATNPTLSLHKTLPPPFRDWWRLWQEEAKSKISEKEKAIIDEKDERVQNLIEAMKNDLQLQEGNKDGNDTNNHEARNQDCSNIEKKTDEKDVLMDNSNCESWEEENLENNKEEKSIVDNDNKNILKNERENKQVKDFFLKRTASLSYQKMLKKRENLPIYNFRNEIIQCMESNNVIVVSGETGCGKSTQVPQYILEDAILKGEAAKTKIICTQPRRVAALSLAERVSDEVGDDKGPGSKDSLVGYQIRMEAKTCKTTKLSYMTTGVLLRKLMNDRTLSDISHIVLDEVHERQADGDFLLVILRDLLEVRKDLKLILMSATINADLFCKYFNKCPLFEVPGRTFPVTEFFLEDLLESTGYVVEIEEEDAVGPMDSTSVTLKGRDGKKFSHNVTWEREEEEEDEVWGGYLDQLQKKGYTESTLRSLSRMDEYDIDYDLIQTVLEHLLSEDNKLCSSYDDGVKRDANAILIFLPGIGEINKLSERLQYNRILGNSSKFWILALHSSISPTEQSRAFRIPPRGVRKIILSTNIAETSVTIEDVFYVIDCGQAREVHTSKNTKGGRALLKKWCPKASANQRKGRAGRVGPGVCCKLFSSFTYTNVMKDFAVPEIMRVPLENMCLTIRSNGYSDSCLNFLRKAPEPPSTTSILEAIDILEEVGALTKRIPIETQQQPVMMRKTAYYNIVDKSNNNNENGNNFIEGNITPLGKHLAKLPVDVRLGKMLIFGAIFQCLDPILSITAFLSSKSPFVVSVDRQQEAKSAHKKFVIPESDFLTIENACKQFIDMNLKDKTRKSEKKFCQTNFLNRITLLEIIDLRFEYLSYLCDIGLIEMPSGGGGSGGNSNSKKELVRQILNNLHSDRYNFNRNSKNQNLVTSVICAGLYPQIAKADYTINNGRTGGPAFFNGNNSSANRVHLHPSSVNSKLEDFSSPWLVFYEKMETTRVFVSPTTTVTPYALLLFGDDLEIDHLNNSVSVGTWINLPVPARTAVIIREVKKKLELVLQYLIEKPLKDMTSNEASNEEGAALYSTVVQTINDLVQEDVKEKEGKKTLKKK